MRKSTGANQFGRYVWQPLSPQASEEKYTARVTRKGCSVKVNSDSKDELVKDMAELLERLSPLAGEGVKDDKED